jgi:hypothetical protein
MKHFSFTLSMPNTPSWNGKWSGEGQLYARTLSCGKADKEPKEGYYHYRWDDGWSVCIEVRQVTIQERNRLRKKTSGFCRYEWMMRSIIEYGDIRLEQKKVDDERLATVFPE